VVSSGFDGREKWGTYTRDTAYYDYADQREYAVGSGRFGTPDPYMASAGLRRPGSFNRYAYVSGDPINFRDPRGLLEAPPEGVCPAEFEECGEWDWLGGWGGGGGGAGGGGLPFVGVKPQDAKDVNVWDALIAATAAVVAAARAAAGQTGILHYPAFLKVVDDCYVPHSRENNSAERLRTYDVLDENGDPWSGPVFFQEQITVRTGELNTRSYPGTWNSARGNVDDLTGFGNYIDSLQQFWAKVSSGIDAFPPGLTVPLMIREIDGTVHGTLSIQTYKNRVDINGDGGKVGDCK
jgi:RHS repeat-associated protein